MLTKEEVIEIRFICTKLGATNQQQIETIIDLYIKAKSINKTKLSNKQEVLDTINKLDNIL